MTEDQKKEPWYLDQAGCVANIIALVALGASLFFSINGCVTEKNRASDLEMRVDELTKTTEVLKGEIAGKDERISELEEETKLSLSKFIREYRLRIKEATDAVQTFRGFDTPNNRQELGARFDQEYAARRQTAKEKLTSLVDHVERWKSSVLKALEGVMNGRVEAVKLGLARDDLDEASSQFATLRDNIEGDIELLIQALEAAQSGDHSKPTVLASPHDLKCRGSSSRLTAPRRLDWENGRLNRHHVAAIQYHSIRDFPPGSARRENAEPIALDQERRVSE